MTPAPKRRSAVWNYFSKADENNLALCNICKKSMKYFGGTTNLRQHMMRKHPTVKLVVKTPEELINCEECNKIITVDNVCCHFETVVVENECMESSPVQEEKRIHLVSELSTPSESVEELDATVKASEIDQKRDILGDAIMKTIRRTPQRPQPSVVPPTQNLSINPICLRISEMLADLPPAQKARLEIKLLQTVYDEVFK